MKTLLITAVIATALPATSALAQADGRFAVGVQVGTPGAGLQSQFALSPVVVLRGGYDVLKWDRDQTYKGIDYDAKIDFKSPGAFVDLHPFRNGFLISGGAYFGDRKVDLDATPTGNVNVGGATFTPAQVGTLTGRIDLESTAPSSAWAMTTPLRAADGWASAFWPARPLAMLRKWIWTLAAGRCRTTLPSVRVWIRKSVRFRPRPMITRSCRCFRRASTSSSDAGGVVPEREGWG